MAAGVILLGDVAARTPLISIACRRCNRRGRQRTDRPPAVRDELADDRARRPGASPAGTCRPTTTNSRQDPPPKFSRLSA